MAPLLLRITLLLLLLVSSASGVVQRSGTFDTNGNTLAPTNYVITGTLSNIGAVNHAAPETNWAAVVNKTTVSTLGNVDIAGSMFVTSAFNAGGVATFSNNLAVALNAGVTGTLGVGGQAALSNNLAVAGAANVTGAVGVGGQATLSNNLAVVGNANITGTMGVGGAATFTNLSASRVATTDSSKNLATPFQSSGQLHIGNASGGYTMGTISAGSGIVVVNGDGSITISFGSNGAMTNVTIWPSSPSSIPAIIQGLASQSVNMLEWRTNGGTAMGAIGSGGGLHIGGSSAAGANNITADGIGSFVGALNVGGTITSTNGIVNNGTESITSTLGVGGVITASNTIVGQVGENLTGALNVGGLTILSNNLVVVGTKNVTGASFHGGVATFTNVIVGQVGANLTGALNAGGAVTLSNTLAVTGKTTLSSNATITAVAATNALEVTAIGGTMAANSNGISTFKITNSATEMLGLYRVWVQTADGTSNTNISTATNTILGTGLGMTNLTAGFWQPGRTLRFDASGQYWTGSPLQTLLLVTINQSNTVLSRIATPASSVTGDTWDFWCELTCLTNGPASGVGAGALQAVGNMRTGGTQNRFTNQVTLLDTLSAGAFQFAATNGAVTTSWQSRSGRLTLIP